MSYLRDGVCLYPRLLKFVWRNKMLGYYKMPRPRKTPGRFAPKNSLRSRKFSVVIHDVKNDAKIKLERSVSGLLPDWSLIAEEPYNHQEGSHLHLYLKYAQPMAKSRVLSYIQKLDLGGRVQADIGRGDFESCKKYLTDPTKKKLLDNNISENVRKLSPAEKYPELTTLCLNCGSKSYDPFISLGDSSYQSGLCLKCANRRIANLIKGPPLPLGPPPE